MWWLRFQQTDAAFVDATRDPVVCDRLIARYRRERRIVVIAVFATIVLMVILLCASVVLVTSHLETALDEGPHNGLVATLIDRLKILPGAMYAFLGASLVVALVHAIARLHVADQLTKHLLTIRTLREQMLKPDSPDKRPG